jgi:hypothetical protein
MAEADAAPIAASRWHDRLNVQYFLRSVSDDGRSRQEPALRHIVVDEWLRERKCPVCGCPLRVDFVAEIDDDRWQRLMRAS